MKGGGEDNKQANNAEHKILGANVILKRKWLTLVVTRSVFIICGGCRVERSELPYYYPSLCCCSVT